MTKTITIPQSVIDELSAGTHALNIEASANGYSSSQSFEFYSWNKPQITLPELGEYNTGFSFYMGISGLNGTATVIGKIDDNPYYQLNFAKDGTYKVSIGDGAVLAMNSGEHTLNFSLIDEQNKTASASTTFIRKASNPVVAVASNLGDKKAAFSISYTIKNVQSEHPTLDAFMDAISDPIVSYPDASLHNSIVIDANRFNALSNGSHTVIISVTNDVGTTNKNVSFNKVTNHETVTGLKLGYKDDTWDKNIVEDRIYQEKEVEYEGKSYLSYADMTPYETEGEVVTGSLLASMSRGIQNALPSNVVVNSDGSMTETGANGISVLTETENGYTEVITDKEGNTLTKNVFFNDDGSIAESTVFTRSNQ